MKTFTSHISEPKYQYLFPHPISQVCFFDIETSGLSPQVSSLYLIGAMTYDDNTKEWILHQWFANDTKSEKEILLSFLSFLEQYDYLYHFNGKTFDIPYVLKKCQRHKIVISEHCSDIFYDTTQTKSIDLLSRIRSLRHSLNLERCNQTSIEKWLGITRTDTFSGGELISVYAEYMQNRLLSPEKCQALEDVLLLHNHDDIAMMLSLSSLLHYDIFLRDSTRQDCSALHSLIESAAIQITQKEDYLQLAFDVPFTFPKELTLNGVLPVSLCEEDVLPSLDLPSLRFKGQAVTVTYPLFERTLKFFFQNPKDYYYLPEEDMAVHKSVAQFVDPAYRKRATAATCYTKKNGVFLPSLVPTNRLSKIDCSLERFYLCHKDKCSFCLLEGHSDKSQLFFKQFLKAEIPFFHK